jgi:D-galactarolactone cycloisomerase
MPLDRVKISSIVAAPLLGESPKGGWSHEIGPEDSVHTLIAVHTDEGITGFGSFFTNSGLVEAALKVLEPFYRGENALEPERVTEKLNQNTFWMGRGGTLTHTISGIDIALWDVLGKALDQPIGRLLGGIYRTKAKMGPAIAQFRDQGFRAFKIGWGPFDRRDDPALDEAIVRAAREAAGADAQLFVDAGASDAYWPQGLKWAIRAAHMLASYQVGWFEETLRAGRRRGSAACSRPAAHGTGRVHRRQPLCRRPARSAVQAGRRRLPRDFAGPRPRHDTRSRQGGALFTGSRAVI